MLKESKHILFFVYLWAWLTQPASAQWVNFLWAESRIPGLESKEAAILFPVQLDGTKCFMQFDSGLDGSRLYRNSLPSKYRQQLNDETITINKFSVGKIKKNDSIFYLIYAENDALKNGGCVLDENVTVVGSLGNDKFLTGHLSLDLPKKRFMFNKGPYQPLKEIKTTHSFNMDLIDTDKGAVPILTITDKNEMKKFLLDTGSAPADLIIYLKENWIDLVGVSLSQVKSFSVMRWNEPIQCYTAPTKRSLAIDDFEVTPGTLATYCEVPNDKASSRNSIFGILGLSLFKQNIVTIDYVARRIYIER